MTEKANRRDGIGALAEYFQGKAPISKRKARELAHDFVSNLVPILKSQESELLIADDQTPIGGGIDLAPIGRPIQTQSGWVIGCKLPSESLVAKSVAGQDKERKALFAEIKSLEEDVDWLEHDTIDRNNDAIEFKYGVLQKISEMNSRRPS